MTSLQHELRKKHPFDSAEQEAHLSLLRTTSVLAAPFQRLLKEHDLSEATFNVLRILRGGAPTADAATPRACHEIGDQMVALVPDVTRLVDRLEKLGLAERARCGNDRRVVHVRITRKGMDVLARLDQPTLDLHRAQLSHMKPEELRELTRLLAKAREPHIARASTAPAKN
jgi:DNA-binding MarR family transcriptional regulator